MWNFKMVSSIPTSGSDWPNHNDLCGTGLFWFRAPKIRTRHNFPLKPFGPVWSLFSGFFGVGRSSGPKGDKINRTRISRTVKVPPATPGMNVGVGSVLDEWGGGKAGSSRRLVLGLNRIQWLSSRRWDYFWVLMGFYGFGFSFMKFNRKLVFPLRL